MRANRARNTGPELRLRKALRDLGGNDYRVAPARLPGRPDIVFRDSRLAVFVNGCFWHRCPYCKPDLPGSHKAFWRLKFMKNKERDSRKRRELRRLGWSVRTVWECRVKAHPESEAIRVLRALGRSPSAASR